MAISVFDLFKIGIGPSSSHTVGPMRAARLFTDRLVQQNLLAECRRIEVRLYGSLASTGKGHGTDKAVLLGLQGHDPETVDVDAIERVLESIRSAGELCIAGIHTLAFDEKKDLSFYRNETLPFHPNGMRCISYDPLGGELLNRCYFSVGGGFVVSESVAANGELQKSVAPDTTVLPHPFHSADELLQLCEHNRWSIAELMRQNERHWRSDAEIDTGLQKIWNAMQACVERGCRTHGVLPGGYKVKRRAAQLAEQLRSDPQAALRDPLVVLDWVNLYALAVNEENAAGGRVVTAPTNGAAGIIPAVLHYYTRFVARARVSTVSGSGSAGSSEVSSDVFDFLLTAAAIGLLYKENASISGAEVGCQGEVGVACSMAAGALCAVMGGTPRQVENAAEIGMEHHLGLTCDPVGGLVQIPCIERNAIAAVKAINAARMALHGDGSHFVSLDKVIKTMRETGADMLTKYKETARGGLAVNIVEC